MTIAEGRYPEGNVRVKFPMDPEGFFVEHPAARARVPEAEQPGKMAA
ncbi:MAG: hypothetical protein M3N18_11375 [Actinomycetota bacterium]|nr:hypothetical protein [Actinomycetota bacterium]